MRPSPLLGQLEVNEEVNLIWLRVEQKGQLVVMHPSHVLDAQARDGLGDADERCVGCDERRREVSYV